MKILITEDDDDKAAEIRSFVESVATTPVAVDVASDMAEFIGKFDSSIAICVIDLRIPAYNGASPDTNGIGVLQAIERIGGGRVKLLAISSYPEEFEAVREKFEARGCMLVSFEQKDVWQSALKLMIVQSQGSEFMEFLIFCALRSERAPYTGMPELRGKAVFKDNITRYDIAVLD